jgi:hypothetical protein
MVCFPQVDACLQPYLQLALNKLQSADTVDALSYAVTAALCEAPYLPCRAARYMVCFPQVDACLQPYLQLALNKLQSAENRLLKDELLLLVANALYYNAGATLGILQQFGAVQQLFGLMFSCIFART